MWGPPAGWDSAASDSHHKTEIKAPTKNAQRNASSFIEQNLSPRPNNYKVTYQMLYGMDVRLQQNCI